MKAKLEFDLDDPDDGLKHLQCVKVNDILCALWDFDLALRNGIEFQGKEGWGDIRRIFYDALDDNGVDLDELWQ